MVTIFQIAEFKTTMTMCCCMMMTMYMQCCGQLRYYRKVPDKP